MRILTVLTLLSLLTFLFAQRIVTVQSFAVDRLDVSGYSEKVKQFFRDWVLKGEVSVLQGKLPQLLIKDMKEITEMTLIERPDHLFLYKPLLFDMNRQTPIPGTFANPPMAYLLNDVTYVPFRAIADPAITTVEIAALLTSPAFNATKTILFGDMSAGCQFFTGYNSTKWKWILNVPTNLAGNCSFDRFVVTNDILFSNTDIDDYGKVYGFSPAEMAKISTHYPIKSNFFVTAKKMPFWVEIVSVSGIFMVLLVCVLALGILGVIITIVKLKKNPVKSNPEYQQVLLE